jgi:flagellar transcriptional activator FlhC
MQTEFVERHIRSLSIAKTCADLGARIRTIAYITGLEHNELVRLLFVDKHTAPRGRPPDSPEWYHQKANLIAKVEAAMFVAVYCRMRNLGFGPTDALVGGFRHYREQCEKTPRISFDRAFDLVCHTQGIWTVDRPQLALATCPRCQSQHLTCLGERPGYHRACPFCQLVKRYWSDKRVQATFPPRALPTVKSTQFGLLSPFLSLD